MLSRYHFPKDLSKSRMHQKVLSVHRFLGWRVIPSNCNSRETLRSAVWHRKGGRMRMRFNATATINIVERDCFSSSRRQIGGKESPMVALSGRGSYVMYSDSWLV